MSTSNPATRTYRPVQFAVMPGSAARGWILGMLYLVLFPLVYAIAQDIFEGTEAGAALESFLEAVGWAGIFGIGFTVPIALTLFLAWLGYRRREYEVGAEGVTERRGIVLRTERFIAYDELEGVTVTESLVQSLYGAGTIRITDINKEEDETVVMKMSYIRNPESVSTNILRHITDVTGATDSELETGGVEELTVESKSISRLSGGDLAAGTGFRYLMPSAILHPRPEAAATYGLVVGAGYALVGGGVLYYLQDWLMGVLDIPSAIVFVASAALGGVVVALLLAGWFYRRYDRIQYELYEDHIKLIQGGETTSFSLDDVADVSVETGDGVKLTEGLVNPWSDVGHIKLLDDQDDNLVVFKYIANSQGVFDALEDWLVANAADEQATTESTGETDPGEEAQQTDHTGMVTGGLDDMGSQE